MADAAGFEGGGWLEEIEFQVDVAALSVSMKDGEVRRMRMRRGGGTARKLAGGKRKEKDDVPAGCEAEGAGIDRWSFDPEVLRGTEGGSCRTHLEYVVVLL